MGKKLDGEVLEKRKERIKKIASRVFQEAVTHGIVDKSGNIHSKSDIDGTASIFLLQQFGIIKDKKIKYVVPGEKKIGAINVDTGKANGIKIETKTPNNLFGSTLIIDQHPDGPSSSTHVVYHALKTLGLIDIKNQLWLEKFIDFVNIIDLLGYEVVSADMKHKPYTLLGLHKKLMSMGTKGLHIIMNYFKNNPYATGLEVLNDKQLSRMLDGNPFEYNKKEKSPSSTNLIISSKSVEKEIMGAHDKLESLKKQKKVVEYAVADKKQKFIVDNRIVERKNEKGEVIAENFLPNGVETALSQGFGLYQVKPSGDVYIYSPIEFGEDLKGIGEQIRGKILLLKKPKDSNKDGMEKYNEQLGKIESVFGINIKKEKKSPKTQSNETLPIQNSDAIKKDIDTHWDRDNEIVRIEEGANPQIILQMGSYEIPLSKDDLGEGLEQLVTFYKEHKKQGVKIVFNLSTLEANVL